MGEVIVVIGAGQIGQAIARRVSFGKHVLLADLHQGNADAAAEVLSNAGFEVSTATVDVSSRESVHALVQTATACGDITGVIHAAGVSPRLGGRQMPGATGFSGCGVALAAQFELQFGEAGHDGRDSSPCWRGRIDAFA